MKKSIKVQPGAMTYCEDKIFFSDLCSNTLYAMSIEGKIAEYLVQFDNECSFQKRLFTSLVTGDKKVFCIPHGAKAMGVYDIKKRKGYSVPLPNKVGEIGGTFKTGIYHNQNVYLLGYGEKNVWVYDVKLDSWDKILIPESKGLFVAGCIKDDCLFIVSKASSNIWRIDCKNRRSEILCLNIKVNGFSDIKTVGENLILTSYDTDVIYSVCGEHIMSTWETQNNFTIWPHGGGIIGKDGDYYFVSTLKYNLKKISMKSGEEECIEIEKYNLNCNTPCSLMSCGENIVIWLYETSEIIKYNVYNKYIEKINLITMKKPEIQFKKNEIMLIEESSICELRDFIKLL